MHLVFIEHLLPTISNWEPFSVTERCDIQYLSDMIQKECFPFVHPFMSDTNRTEPEATRSHRESCCKARVCRVCDCGHAEDLANIAGLPSLAWEEHTVNGPLPPAAQGRRSAAGVRVEQGRSKEVHQNPHQRVHKDPPQSMMLGKIDQHSPNKISSFVFTRNILLLSGRENRIVLNENAP